MVKLMVYLPDLFPQMILPMRYLRFKAKNLYFEGKQAIFALIKKIKKIEK